jgi:hypothetical protein
VLVAARRERLAKHAVVDIDKRRGSHHPERHQQGSYPDITLTSAG